MEVVEGLVFRRNAKVTACLDLAGLALFGVFLTCLVIAIPAIDMGKRDIRDENGWYGLGWMYSGLIGVDHFEFLNLGLDYIWHCSMADGFVTLVQIGANVRLINSLGQESQQEVTVTRTRFWLFVNAPVAVAYLVWRTVDGFSSGSAYWITLIAGGVVRTSFIFFVARFHFELEDKVTAARELREAVRENRVNRRMMMGAPPPVGVDPVAGVPPGSADGIHLE